MTAIKTEKLTKKYGTVTAVSELDLEIPDNTVFGFLGPNGAGKTTTVKLLTGFSHPTSGTATVAGQRIGLENLSLQSKIGLLPDVPAFYDWMTGREFLSFIGDLHGLSKSDAAKRADELLELVDLKKAGNRRAGGYSRGMRQRLGIAQALVNRPAVLFMDEPTSALDPMGRREVLELILKLKETATIFMSTHILSDVERVCDMVGIINSGRLVTVSSIESLRNQYAQSAFEMEFMEDPSLLVPALQKVDWLKEPVVTVENGTPVLRINATDLQRARKELPGLISRSGLTLTRYEMSMPSLEDIFISLLNRSRG